MTTKTYQFNNSHVTGTYQIVMDDKLLAANTFIFFVAGFETTASTLSFCLLELAANDDIQTKLRNEIITVCNKHNNEVNLETIKDMVYMERVIQGKICINKKYLFSDKKLKLLLYSCTLFTVW